MIINLLCYKSRLEAKILTSSPGSNFFSVLVPQYFVVLLFNQNLETYFYFSKTYASLGLNLKFDL